MFLKSLYKAPAEKLIDGGVLEELFSNDPTVFQAGRGNELHIDLNPLPRVSHLLIRLWDIFRIGRMNRHDTLFFEKPVKTGDEAGITTLQEFHQKNNEGGIRVTPAQIGNEFDFIWSMLIGMMVWAPGTVTQRVQGAIEASFPTVNILPVSFVFYGSLGNAKFIGVGNQRQTVSHILCYTVHAESLLSWFMLW